MCHLTSTGAETGRGHVCLDLIFHERRAGSKGHVWCRGPAFSDILCHRCLSGSPAACCSRVWAGWVWTEIWGYYRCVVFLLVLLPPSLAFLCGWLLVVRHVWSCRTWGWLRRPQTLVCLAASAHVLTPWHQEHFHFKTFLNSVPVVGFCVFGWCFFRYAACFCSTEDLCRGTPVLILCNSPWATLLSLHACRRCSPFERVLNRNQ